MGGEATFDNGCGDHGREAGLGRTARKPAVLAFFDWDSKLPNFQKKMAADAANKMLLKVGLAVLSRPPH